MVVLHGRAQHWASHGVSDGILGVTSASEDSDVHLASEPSDECGPLAVLDLADTQS